jgi:serine/threonine protein phosphatase PrpC
MRGRLEHVVLVEGARGEGQDRAAVYVDREGVTIALADGAGGRGGGAEAAARAVDHFRERPAPGELTSRVIALDRALARDPVCGEATLVVARIVDDAITGVSVGDSGAWLIGADAVDVLTERQRRKPRLGSGTSTPVEFHGRLAGATLLVASDGLLKYAPAPTIAACARTRRLSAAPRELAALVRLRSGALPDDLGMVLVRALG